MHASSHCEAKLYTTMLRKRTRCECRCNLNRRCDEDVGVLADVNMGLDVGFDVRVDGDVDGFV
jgi:hypothetical protein